MELKVVWTKRAKKNYIKILTYIEKEFGGAPAEKYHSKVEELLRLVQSFPELGVRQIGHNNLRGIILFRRTTIFYSFDEKIIRIINVIDNRWKK
jgi:plasmid stabilization system protein ParE